MPRTGRRDDGAAAVEFALVGSFILVPILLGILAFGFYFFSATTVNTALREGARAAAVGVPCGDWQLIMQNRLEAVNWQSATMTERPTRLDEFDVTIQWTALDLVWVEPNQTAAVTHRVERVPSPPAGTGACSVTP